MHYGRGSVLVSLTWPEGLKRTNFRPQVKTLPGGMGARNSTKFNHPNIETNVIDAKVLFFNLEACAPFPNTSVHDTKL